MPGQLVALWTLTVLLSLPYVLLVRGGSARRPVRAIALIMPMTVAVAAPFGRALAAALPRETEGTLVLLTVVGLRMVMDPANCPSGTPPFWFSREIGTYAIGRTGGGYLSPGRPRRWLTVISR